MLISLLFILAEITALFAQEAGSELGARYLKLGNTYREARQYEKAADYLNKGKAAVEADGSWKGRYWTAVAYEFYGYLFRDIGMSEESIEYLKNAKNQYQQIISMTDGSPVAVESAINSMKALSDQLYSLENSAIAGLPTDVLNYDNQKLKQIPASIPDDVKNISLADNRFTMFPAGLLRFKGLHYINLAGNRIKSIPSNIDDLQELHSLDLSGNRLKDIPPSFGNMKNLRELDLSDNRLKDIPPTLCSMTELKVLNLKNNKIPFEKITNIIKCLPNTNVLFDEYILKQPSAEQELLYGK
jgi:Leucine-rich repeat (LRR) protein